MKRIGMISTAVLSLALGVATPAYALQEQHDQQEEQKAKPAQEEKKAQPEKSAKPEQKPAAQQKTAKPEEKNAQKQSNDTKSEQKNAQQQEKNTRNAEKPAQQQQHAQQAQPGKQEQRASSNGGGGGGRIPEDRFKANFGEQHRFRVTQADYSTNHRFQYGGYWFGFAAPWPSNWLYTQDVYVIEINGVYYLCNPMYPGVNIMLAVSL